MFNCINIEQYTQTYGSGWTADHWPTYTYTPGCSSSCRAEFSETCGSSSGFSADIFNLPEVEGCYTATDLTASTLDSSLTSTECIFTQFCQVIFSFFSLSKK